MKDRKKEKQDVDVGKKDNFYTRLSLLKIVELNKNITDEQKNAVKSIGFEDLLELQCTVLKHPLCKWLVDHFNPLSCTLEIHGHEIKITCADVGKMFGLPSEGQPVICKGLDNEIDEWCEKFEVYKSHILLQKLTIRIKECKSAGTEFKVMYCLFALGYLLCPITDFAVKKEMLHAVKNVNLISQFNWSQLVLDSLADEIQRYRCLEQNYVGCCLFLLVIFIPMNYDNNHWLLVIVNIGKKCLEVGDSMVRQRTMSRVDVEMNKLVRTLVEVLKEVDGSTYVNDNLNLSIFPIVRPAWVPQQNNGYDADSTLL